MKLFKQLSTLSFFIAFTFVATAQVPQEEGIIETNHDLEKEAQVETVTIVVLKTEIIQVDGISEDKDISNIVKQLKTVDGIKQCRAKKKGKFYVTFDPQKVDLPKIKTSVAQIPANINSKIKPFKVIN